MLTTWLGAEYLVDAVMVYTTPRYTKDLDVWVRPSKENARRVRVALIAFGAPVADLTEEDLAAGGTTFQMGIAPQDLLDVGNLAKAGR